MSCAETESSVKSHHDEGSPLLGGCFCFSSPSIDYDPWSPGILSLQKPPSRASTIYSLDYVCVHSHWLEFSYGSSDKGHFVATPSAPCPELALPECTNCFWTKGCLMSPSAPWLCLDSLWYRDQNCQCFLSQQRQNMVASCTPGEVLGRPGHVRGGRFHVPSSQWEGTFTGHKGSFCLVGTLPLWMGWWLSLQRGEITQRHSEACNPAAGCRATAEGPHPERLFKSLYE